MASGTLPRPLQKLYDLDVTVVSAKHLKNVNWRNGDLTPYVILWVDPDRRQSTKPDDSGSNRPVWNERFVLPLGLAPRDSTLTLEVFHSKPSETPKPLVGTLRFELRDLPADSGETGFRLGTFELQRPSGRPHGKIRLKIGLIERPTENYRTAPPSGYYCRSAPPPPMPCRGNSASPYSSIPPPASFSPPPPPQPYYSCSDLPTEYYSSYWAAPQPVRPSYERHSSLGVPGPSAPVDYTPYDYHKRNAAKPGIGMGTGLAVGAVAGADYTPYDYHKQNAAKPGIGMGTGLAVGAVAGALGGLALEEGVEYEEEKFAENVENDLASTANSSRYGNYRSHY